MRGGFIDGIGRASFRTDLPEPGIVSPEDVKIRVRSTGICGSEVHAYRGLHKWRVPPLVSGHEFAGDVVEIGSAVTNCKVNDRVTAEPQYGCGKCYFCQKGEYNVCLEKKILGATYWSGSFGEYVVVPQRTIVKLADNVSYDEGALIEPIAVGMHAVRQNKVGPSDTVVVVGTGTIGLGVFLSAKLVNPKKIIMADIVDYNLQKAKEMGAHYVINSRTENVVSEIMKLTESVGSDVTFLAFADALSVKQATEFTRSKGTISQIAILPDDVAFPYGNVQVKELHFVGSNMYTIEDYRLVCDAISHKKMELSKFITKTFPIERMPEAMELLDKRLEPNIKVMLHF